MSYTPTALDQYSAVGAITPTYDRDGNLTYDGTFTYGYDAESRLISASGAGVTAAYAYDGQGRRKSKTVNGAATIFVPDPQGRAVLDYDGTSGSVLDWYAFGAGPNEVLNQMNLAAATRATFIPDIQGSILASLDAASGTLTKFGYQPYGDSDTTAGSFRYTGARIDAETSGLYDFRARMYSPMLGRFLQADPAGTAGGANLYAYVGNDPLNAIDPYGTQAVPGIVIGAISGGTAGYIAGGWTGAIIGAVVGGGVGAAAAPLSATAAAAVLAATGSSTLSATTAGVVFTAVNTAAGAGATIVTNGALGNPPYQGVGSGALIGGLAPVLSGETALVGMGGAAATGLPALTDYVLSGQTGIGVVLGTAATSLTLPASSNVPTTGLNMEPGTLNFESQQTK